MKKSDPVEFIWRFDIDVPRPQLWRFVSDTDRINRLAGMSPIRYVYEPAEGGGSRVRASLKAGGIQWRWIERPAVWQEPERYELARDYEGGPLEYVESGAELTATRGGAATRLVHTMRIQPRGFVGRLLARYVGGEAEKGFARAYGLAETWARGEDLPAVGTEPVAEAASDVAGRLGAIGRELSLEGLADRLTRYLTTRPASEIAILRPYRLADAWQVERSELLRLFLHATRAGHFDLEWALICPSCRGSKTALPSLQELQGEGHCPSCNIDFGVHFDRSVEVIFRPSPLGLAVEQVEYCHAGPGNTPHWQAGWSLSVGRAVETRLTVEPGRHQFVSPQLSGGAYVDFRHDPSLPAAARIAVEGEALVGVPAAMAAGEIDLTLASDRPAEVRLARTAWADDTVTAAEVTSLQEFRTLFGSEILAPGASFSIRTMAFLFSDLVGSTAMYEAIGDAPAFGLVRDHFGLLQEIYLSAGGCLVKTIGDAVMAVFREPSGAVRAAIEMQERIGALRDPRHGRGLELRIGLHRGPCIAMEANGRLDYFGTTVNLAARVQGAADGREITMTEGLLEDPAVQRLLSGRGLEPVREVLRFKGIAGETPVLRVRMEAAARG